MGDSKDTTTAENEEEGDTDNEDSIPNDNVNKPNDKSEIYYMFERIPKTLSEIRQRDPTELKFAVITTIALSISYILLLFQMWYVLAGAIVVYLVAVTPILYEHKREYFEVEKDNPYLNNSDED